MLIKGYIFRELNKERTIEELEIDDFPEDFTLASVNDLLKEAQKELTEEDNQIRGWLIYESMNEEEVV